VRPKAEDAEGLVAQCLHRNGRFVEYRKPPKHSEEDKAGIDFIITFRHSGIAFTLQVKTADTAEVLGIWLPLPLALPPRLASRISPEMLRSIRRHSHKHPDVRYMLFVPRPNGEQPPATIINRIWHEVMHLYENARTRYEIRILNQRAVGF